MKRFLFLFSVAVFFININVNAAYITNFPVTLRQPDGTLLKCFATGDEYYNWLHDEDNFTIIKNTDNGFYCYAILENEVLKASEYIAGIINPYGVGLKPGINIPGSRILKLRESFIMKATAAKGLKNGNNSKITGNINNLVIYIRFAGEAEFSDDTLIYYDLFNGLPGTNSMKNYYNEASYNNVNIQSYFFPKTSSNTVLSYQDSYDRSYYQPYDAVTNPAGYQPSEIAAREHELLKNAVNYVSSQIPAGLNLDYNNDGYVDNICFIVSGTPTAWSSLLWPHRWSLYSQNVYIHGLQVWDYNLQLQEHLLFNGNGVLCHEMFHTLGAPDLYHYNQDALTPVGVWDLMESNQEPPQHMCAYMKFRYGGWINNIPIISSPGTYQLNPLTSSSGNCFRINSPYSTSEYFVVEYRRKTGVFESSLPGSGIVVYRINTGFDGMGNAAYDGSSVLDEVYVLRPNGTLYSTGQPDNAFFSAAVNRKKLNDQTNPPALLSDGSDGGLDISSVSYPGSVISFNLNGGLICNDNAETSRLASPSSGCFLGNYDQVSAVIKNNGNQPLNPGFGISYVVDKNLPVNEVYSGPVIGPGDSAVYTFSQTAALSERGNHKVSVYTALTGDCDLWNDTLTTVVSNGQFDYLADDVTNFDDVYIDLGNDGTVINTANSDNANSAPVSIGFDFGFNCDMFSTFILNTNGFIKFGSYPPSSDSLYFTDANHSKGGVFNSLDTADVNIIAPFNHDLTEGSGTAEYRVYTSGVAPDRVCTIQFKNLKDKTAVPATQYDNIEFQIKLYETSNVIDFVYGNWVASSETSNGKTAACGLKGAGNLPGQLLVARKGSAVSWENVIFENVNYSSTATFNFGNPPLRPAPDAGRTFRFVPDFIVTRINDNTEKQSSLTYRLFPNPSYGLFYLQMPGTGLENTVGIFNSVGENVYSGHFFNDGGPAEIDMSYQPSGLYFVNVISENNIHNFKVMLVK